MQPRQSRSLADGESECAPRAVIRVLVCSEIRLYRDGIAQGLAGAPGTEVAGTVGTCAEALEAVEADAPQVVLLDMATADSLAGARELSSAWQEVPIVALGVRERQDEVVACAEAGVSGFVTREQGFADLVAAVESAARGETLCSPAVAATLLRRVATLAGVGAGRPPRQLTARELEVVDLIDEGLSNKQIAQRLTIQLATVKNHVHSILEKVGAAHRAQALAYLREQGLVRPRQQGTRPTRTRIQNQV